MRNVAEWFTALVALVTLGVSVGIFVVDRRSKVRETIGQHGERLSHIEGHLEATSYFNRKRT